MSFSLVKAGGWAFGEILTSAQMNALDADHANALDALNGGAYTLVAPLSVDGDTVTFEDLVADDLAVTDDIDVGDDASVGGNLEVTGTASFRLNNVTVADANESLTDGYQTTPYRRYTGANARTTTLTAGMSTYGWFLLVNAQTANRAVVDADTATTMTTLLPGQWVLVARVGANWQILMRGATNGNIQRRFYSDSGSSSYVIGPNSYDYVILNPSTTINNDIPTGTYLAGQFITIVNRSATPGNTVTVRNPALSAIVTITGGNWADVVYDGTNWVLGKSSL